MHNQYAKMKSLRDKIKYWNEIAYGSATAQPKAAPYMVTAGDPANDLIDDGRLIHLNQKLPDGKMQFVVCGISMTPRGIEDGDNLIGRPIGDRQGIKEGQMLIIKVDPKYYPTEKPVYDYKLRCAIMAVDTGMDADAIIEQLKGKDSQPEIWLQENQDNLRAKLEKARSIYPTDKLMLSCTYREGKLCYSFHKIDAVEYIAETRIRREYPNESYSLIN